ncbi:transcription elongation factor GreA [Dehalogenimonas sp. WBC-2]|nr:transcription elongation factor GreA [Dehalogenimonas sp. WBC-2]
MTSEKSNQPSTLVDAALRYLASLSAAKRESVTPAIMNFVRWYGGDKSVGTLSALKLSEYASGQPAGEEAASKLRTVKDLFLYFGKQGWTETSMSTHLKIKRTPVKVAGTARRSASVDKLVLTPEKQNELETELALLKEKRIHILDDIKRAAADKDLKENAPYHAAREEKAKLDGKIEELATLLKHAVIDSEHNYAAGNKAELGRCITMKELATGAICVYTLVMPREVNPKSGRISPASPIGKALIGRTIGETIEVVAPAYTFRYTIEAIE